jgi:hypothetical protein
VVMPPAVQTEQTLEYRRRCTRLVEQLRRQRRLWLWSHDNWYSLSVLPDNRLRVVLHMAHRVYSIETAPPVLYPRLSAGALVMVL